ncbi:MAG: hypothetical protein ACPG49_01525 [Chitinophagales bacterium]
MSIAKQIRSDIVEMLFKIDDIDTLNSIKHQLEVVHVTKEQLVPLFMKAVRPIRENVSIEQIMAEQNYKPITYKEFRKKADEIEWEESLEELLGALTK